jgi:hypothetical protein
MYYGFFLFSDTQRVLDRSVSVFYLNYVLSLDFTLMRLYEIRSSELGLYNAAQYIDLDATRMSEELKFNPFRLN